MITLRRILGDLFVENRKFSRGRDKLYLAVMSLFVVGERDFAVFFSVRLICMFVDLSGMYGTIRPVAGARCSIYVLSDIKKKMSDIKRVNYLSIIAHLFIFF